MGKILIPGKINEIFVSKSHFFHVYPCLSRYPTYTIKKKILKSVNWLINRYLNVCLVWIFWEIYYHNFTCCIVSLTNILYCILFFFFFYHITDDIRQFCESHTTSYIHTNSYKTLNQLYVDSSKFYGFRIAPYCLIQSKKRKLFHKKGIQETKNLQGNS